MMGDRIARLLPERDDRGPFDGAGLVALCDGLADFVRLEARAQRDQHEKHLRRPLEERVLDERCLADLRADGGFDAERRTFAFRCDGKLGNTARFREGDRLRLHRGDYESGFDVVLASESEQSLELRPEARQAELGALLGAAPGGWMLDESFFDTEKLLLQGLEDAMASADGRERVLALFAGCAQREMEFGFDDFSDGDAYANLAGLNESQGCALESAVNTRHCHLVQGPPGTGKTYVLAQTAATLVERGERVLLTAFTHRAIHHALRVCDRVIRDPERIAKIGVPAYDPALAPVRQFESWAKSPLRHKHGGLLVGATPYSAASKRLGGVNFDTVIIDEASQMTIPLAILAMLKGRKFVFFGDHRQLPPVLQSVPKREASGWSVFGSLAREAEVTTLRTTYRLNTQLATWPSESFYSGELRPDASVAGRTMPHPNKLPENPALAADASLVFVTCGHSGRRTASREEADTVAELIAEIVAAGLPAAEIGVVTPFRRQARLIKKRLRTHPSLPSGAAADIVTDTVERFQGQEREVVVLSLTTSDTGFLERIADFYYQQERWNVAVTRARSKVIIVGCPQVARFVPLNPESIDEVALIRGLLEQALHV